MQESKIGGFHKVVFLRDGRPTSLTFPSYVLAFSFLKTLHSRRKGRIEPAAEATKTYTPPPDRKDPVGTVVVCPRGPRVRTWYPRRPRIQRRFPNFSRSTLHIPTQSSGFALTFPEERAPVVTVLIRHSSYEEAIHWTTHRFGKMVDGEWWPKDKPKSESK